VLAIALDGVKNERELPFEDSYNDTPAGVLVCACGRVGAGKWMPNVGLSSSDQILDAPDNRIAVAGAVSLDTAATLRRCICHTGIVAPGNVQPWRSDLQCAPGLLLRRAPTIAVSPATQMVISWPWLILKCLKPCVAWARGNQAIRCLFRPTCLRDTVIFLCGMVKNAASEFPVI
jgi:hypothetical protein